jgi:ferritin
MLKTKVQEALNQQINAELASAYLYLSMAAYFDAKNFTGMAHWMRVQAQEEVGHAMRIYKHVNDRQGRVLLTAIEAPKTEWQSPLEVFENAYHHEQKVTSLINNLVKIALQENDYATQSFLQWFIDEQVEEEAAANVIVEKLRLVGDKGHALIMLDKGLGERKAGDD